MQIGWILLLTRLCVNSPGDQGNSVPEVSEERKLCRDALDGTDYTKFQHKNMEKYKLQYIFVNTNI